jgi:iron complex transport system permease protein
MKWTITALAVALGALVASLLVGDYPVRDLSPRAVYVILELRLPRAVGAIAVGAAFGLSGALVQRVVRNPLASPDIVGINAGAAAVAVLLIVIFSAGPHVVAIGALTGALTTAAAIYSLARRRGGVSGNRLVLTGIGVTAMLTSLTSYLLSTAGVYTAEHASIWLTGSLAGRTWDQIVPVLIALAVLLPVALALTAPLKILELGDDLATALGLRPEQTRATLLVTAVLLAAVATAAAGPIAFVALAAPQIARLLVREPALLPSTAMGAALLSLADLAARRILAPTELPVGVLTTVLGAPLLIWLLRAGLAGAARGGRRSGRPGR